MKEDTQVIEPVASDDIASDLAKAMDLPADQEGVMVGRVEVDSPADEAGLHGSFQAITINGERQLVGGGCIAKGYSSFIGR